MRVNAIVRHAESYRPDEYFLYFRKCDFLAGGRWFFREIRLNVNYSNVGRWVAFFVSIATLGYSTKCRKLSVSNSSKYRKKDSEKNKNCGRYRGKGKDEKTRKKKQKLFAGCLDITGRSLRETRSSAPYPIELSYHSRKELSVSSG